MKSIIIMVVSLLLLSVYAWSQEPSPGRLNTVQAPQDQSKKYKTNTDTKKQEPADFLSSQKEPFSQSNNVQSSKDAEKQNDYASPEWWLVYVTIALVFVTTGLAIYTARLWGATKILAKEAKNTSIRQTSEMQASLAIAKISTEHIKESVDLARKEFISTHRPKIILRDAYCVDNEMGSLIEVRYVLVNIGKTHANIISSSLDLKLINGPDFGAQIPPLIHGNKNDTGTTFIEPGEEIERIYSGTRRWHENDGSRLISEDPCCGVFFCGHIIYEDASGIKRHMAFWRKYDLMESRFYFSSHPAMESLNYAD